MRVAVVAALAVFLFTSAVVAQEGFDLPQRYVGAAGTLVLPQGGSSMRRLGGAAARAGLYLSDALAVEEDGEGPDRTDGRLRGATRPVGVLRQLLAIAEHVDNAAGHDQLSQE